MKTSSIRPHRKNRTGCKTCKRRKIRCDEQKPSCLNCIKHSVPCDFPSLFSTPTTPSSSYLSPSSPNDAPLSKEPTPKPPLPDLKMLELELMHNYSTSTANSLVTTYVTREIFRISIPKLALSHSFLMRSLLAISALHIAYYTPSRREQLTSYAMEQHQASSRAAFSMMMDLTEDSYIPIYIFSVLTYVFAMALPPPDDDSLLLVNDHAVADWIYLLRGTREIISMSYDRLDDSEFSPMFAAGRRRHQLRDVDSTPHPALFELLQFLKGKVTNKERLAVYEPVVEEMRKTFSVVSKLKHADLQLTDISIWIFKITDEYLALLKERDHAALVILAYFCVLLRHLESHWWMAGRSEHIMTRIYRFVDDQEYRCVLRWPMEEIGWLPPADGGAVPMEE